MTIRPIRLLLVDDSPSDRGLAEFAFEESRIVNELSTAEEGEAALRQLRDPATPLPDLILLDLNMPGMDGREFLSVVKADERLCGIPVVILTSSVADEDVSEAYRAQCAGYIRKPVTLEGLIEVVRGIERYWFAIVERVPHTG